jgi:16S rRNA (uracil1498-N3)-methyltransferase
VGETVQVLSGAGQVLTCEVRDSERHRMMLEVVSTRSSSPSPHQLTLLQAIPKGKLMEEVIQKATELGVHRIVPIISERVVVRLDPQDAISKTVRWRQVAVEAIKQCGSAWLPHVGEPVTPEVFLDRGEECELAVVGSLQPNAQHPRHYFEEFRRARNRKPKTISVWVGPEGDFTPAELKLMESAGVRPINLGPLVLRTDTAAIYSLSVLNYELAGR